MAIIFNQLAQFFECNHIACRAVAFDYLIDLFLQQRGADPAWRAKSAALMREKLGEIMNRVENVAAGIENNE